MQVFERPKCMKKKESEQNERATKVKVTPRVERNEQKEVKKRQDVKRGQKEIEGINILSRRVEIH